MIKWLHLAAAPTFTVMAVSMLVLDSSAPNALCSAGGGFALSGMAPMYLLMAFFHSAPWLKLTLGRPGVTLFTTPSRSSNVQTTEQKP